MKKGYGQCSDSLPKLVCSRVGQVSGLQLLLRPVELPCQDLWYSKSHLLAQVLSKRIKNLSYRNIYIIFKNKFFTSASLRASFTSGMTFSLWCLAVSLGRNPANEKLIFEFFEKIINYIVPSPGGVM